MLKAIVYSATGEKDTDVQLPDKIFAVKVSADLIHQAVVTELANLRNSIAHTKTRGEVRGGGKKPWKQKGTGRARAGSIRSPLWKGGGVTFGPRSARNFSKALNRPQFRRSLLATLSQKFAAKHLYIVEGFKLDAISSKKLLAEVLKLRAKLSLGDEKMNIIIPRRDKNLEYSARNLQGLAILRVSEITPYKLLKEKITLIYREALSVIEQTFVKS